MVDPIRLCLVKHPQHSHVDQTCIDAQWEDLHYLDRQSYDTVAVEFGALEQLLFQEGVELIYLPHNANAGIDSIYVHDPVVITRRGAILGYMGKAQRAGEPDAAASYLRQIGVPILGRIEGPGLLEGGDVLWLDERTVAVGQGYRTNVEGLRQFQSLLLDAGLVDEVIPVPLPHWTGPNDCLHLLSFISPVDHDKAVVYSRLMPVPFRQRLLERGMTLIEVPEEEYDSLACNVLAVAPGRCLMVEGNPRTQRRLEEAGVHVRTFPARDLCIKGGGGPTCLTRPLLRVPDSV